MLRSSETILWQKPMNPVAHWLTETFQPWHSNRAIIDEFKFNISAFFEFLSPEPPGSFLELALRCFCRNSITREETECNAQIIVSCESWLGPILCIALSEIWSRFLRNQSHPRFAKCSTSKSRRPIQHNGTRKRTFDYRHNARHWAQIILIFFYISGHLKNKIV